MALHSTTTDRITRKTDAEIDEEIAYLAKRHRIFPAIVREIVRRSGVTERAAIEREIAKGRSRL